MSRLYLPFRDDFRARRFNRRRVPSGDLTSSARSLGEFKLPKPRALRANAGLAAGTRRRVLSARALSFPNKKTFAFFSRENDHATIHFYLAELGGAFRRGRGGLIAAAFYTAKGGCL